jgi:hypothetical protein
MRIIIAAALLALSTVAHAQSGYRYGGSEISPTIQRVFPDGGGQISPTCWGQVIEVDGKLWCRSDGRFGAPIAKAVDGIDAVEARDHGASPYSGHGR